jgi:hypothetical protein
METSGLGKRDIKSFPHQIDLLLLLSLLSLSLGTFVEWYSLIQDLSLDRNR